MNRDLSSTLDAIFWVEEWMSAIKKNPSIPTDKETMLGWFANAIMAGYDQRTARQRDVCKTCKANQEKP